MLFNIAIKNLFGAKLRTSLNVFVTSISFFLVIFVSGMYDGMREHAKNITIETEVAGGTYWHPEYDSMDPRTFEDSHSIIPIHIKKLIDQKNAFGVLVSQASIYPNGRIMPVVMKGITPDQNIVNMPTSVLDKHIDISINCLNSWGYKYNKIMAPRQPKSGLVDLSSKFVLVVGSKGLSKNNRLTIKSDQSTDLIDYAKKTGNRPFLFIGEVVNEKNWMYCIN